MDKRFQLLLFSTNMRFIQRAISAGIDGIIVDWESVGKRGRQRHADTQINCDTVDDLRRVRACTSGLVLCRINGYSSKTPSEVEEAIDAGADEVLLPMVSQLTEVRSLFELVDGRCGVGILVETELAVQLASQLARFSLSRVYVGLNDLAIERRSHNIFTAISDSTVEQVRRAFTVPFAFGGLTLPKRGYPIPCRLLISEMSRLRCDFAFLRRSFLADVQESQLQWAVSQIRKALLAAHSRTPEQILCDQRDLHAAIAAWRPSPV